MWLQLAYLLSWQLLRVTAGVADIEALLLGGDITDAQCDHESGKEARCVKESLCAPDELSPDNAHSESREEADGVCGFPEVCCPKNRIRDSKKAMKPRPLGCGYINPGSNNLRELSDRYADFGEFPWMIFLMRKEDSSKNRFKDEYIGGGSLIDPSVIITVAHKVDEIEASELKCRAGEWDIGTEDELYKHQDRDVKKIIIHKDFVRAYAHNDIALIILKEPFDVAAAPHIGVACLELEMPPPGTLCYGMGWGRDFLYGDRNAAILKKVQLPLLKASRCQNIYRNSRLGLHYTLHKSLTCAGGEAGIDTCNDDGGSPLVCPIPDKLGLRYSVVGMVAYGLECGTANIPGVYVKIPEVYDWVLKEMTVQGYNKRDFVYRIS